MAYVSQDLKAKIAPGVKEVLKKYGLKGSLAVHHRSTLVLNISSGKIDFFAESISGEYDRGNGYQQVNVYHTDSHYKGEARKFFAEVLPLLNTGNWDRSDVMSDYFDVGFYVSINVGKWDKPYELSK